jgi:hypothetical protein
MALIVETGAIVANANTYVTESELDAYADNLGVTISGDAELLLINAAVFINSKELLLNGQRVKREQIVAYPRANLLIEGFVWQNDEIPFLVKTLQMALALELDAGIDLYNPGDSEAKSIKRVKVEGAVEVEYAVNEDTNPGLYQRRSVVDAIFKALTGSGGNGIWSITRV